MEAKIGEDRKICLRGITIEEAQLLKEGLRSQERHDRWLLGERRSRNGEMVRMLGSIQLAMVRSILEQEEAER